MENIVIKVDSELAELIPRFLENRHTDIKTMQEALKKENYQQIERIGHGMKGAGSGFGFDAVTEIGTRIESAAKNHDLESIRKEIGVLEHYLQHLEVVYE